MSSDPITQAWKALAAVASGIVPARLPLAVAKADVDAVVEDIEIVRDRFQSLLATYGDAVVDTVPGADQWNFDDARSLIDDAISGIRSHLIDLGEQLEADAREREADRAGWAKAARMGVD